MCLYHKHKEWHQNKRRFLFYLEKEPAGRNPEFQVPERPLKKDDKRHIFPAHHYMGVFPARELAIRTHST